MGPGPGWNWNNYITRVNRVEGLVNPSKEIAEVNSIETTEWKVGREGPIKLSFPPIVEEGERKIREVCYILRASQSWELITYTSGFRHSLRMASKIIPHR